MRCRPRRWRILPSDDAREHELAASLGVSALIARLLVQRGLDNARDAHEFLNPSLDHLPDPLLLPDAEAACERLKRALANRERILVHGDYDGDGVTSAALWVRLLRKLSATSHVSAARPEAGRGNDESGSSARDLVQPFIPHRQRDGYDMRMPAVELARKQGVSLIITTDCGIQRIEEVEQARAYGIDVIVTDHHQPNASGELPSAVAVVNPHRSGSRYPFPDLAGVGVAFRLGEALVRHLGMPVAGYRRAYLDLAALGTVTDVVPLLRDNRVIVRHGLEAIRTSQKQGLKALIRVAGYAEGAAIDTRSIAFGLGPRLNAAGRMDEAAHAAALLLTECAEEANMLADRLDGHNTARREMQARIFEEAMQQVTDQVSAEARCIVVSGSGWPAGIIGIVASKIVERACRPCVAIALDEATGACRGSARSIPAFHMLDAIHACRHLLDEYGGHAHAAGLAIEQARVPAFQLEMNRIATEQLTEEDLQPCIEVDAEVAPSELTQQVVADLEAFAPFGAGNPEPCFVSRQMRVAGRERMGQERRDLKLMFRVEGPNANGMVKAPWFRSGEMEEHIPMDATLDVCYRPRLNVWNGSCSVEFNILDIAPGEW